MNNYVYIKAGLPDFTPDWRKGKELLDNYLEEVKSLCSEKDNEVIAFIDHELELLEKKNAADRKPTAQQIANEGIKTAIIEGMEPNRLYTVTEVIKSIPECADMTNQRVSALVRQLVDAGKVERTEEKRKAFFRFLSE